MQHSLKGLLFCGFLLLVPFLSNAQNQGSQDFIEFKSGEILSGRVLIYGGQKKYEQVTLIIDNTSTNYFPNQVTAFEYGDNLRFEVDERSNRFWQVLVKGELSLYKNKESYFLKNTEGDIFDLNDKVKLKENNGVKFTDKNTSWRRELAKAAQACPNQLGLVQITKFKDNSISDFIKYYNECRSSPSVIYNSDRSKMTARLGIALGAHTVNSEAAPRNLVLLQKAEGTSNSFEVGITAEIYLKNTLERFTFTPSILYRNLSSLITSTQRRDSGGLADVHHDIYYDANLVSIPLEFKYALNRVHPQLYIKGAFIVDYSLSTELEAYQELETSPTEVFISAPEIDELPKLFSGYGASIGAQFQLGNLKGNIEAQYQSSFTSELNSIFRITHQRIGAGIKVFF